MDTKRHVFRRDGIDYGIDILLSIIISVVNMITRTYMTI